MLPSIVSGYAPLDNPWQALATLAQFIGVCLVLHVRWPADSGNACLGKNTYRVPFSKERAGEVFGQPDQVELDVLVRDGKVILVAIKSALNRGHVHFFNRKAQYYSQQTSRVVDRKLIVTPYADERAQELALALGVEICTDVTALQEPSPVR